MKHNALKINKQIYIFFKKEKRMPSYSEIICFSTLTSKAVVKTVIEELARLKLIEIKNNHILPLRKYLNI